MKKDDYIKLCLASRNAKRLYGLAHRYNLVRYQIAASPNVELDYIQATIVKNCKNATEIYQLMRKYKLAKITPAKTTVTYNDVKLVTKFNLASVDVYQLYKPGVYPATIFFAGKDSFDTYTIYRYGIYGKEFKFKYQTQNIATFINKSVLRKNGSSPIMSSLFVYSYFKDNNRPVTHNVEPVYTREPRRIKYEVKFDTPDDKICGLVNTQYYTTDEKRKLRRDKYNNTTGELSLTVDVYETMFHDIVKKSSDARERKNDYNAKCVKIVCDIVKHITKNKRRVNDARIIYARRGNMRIALYAIIIEQNKPARIIYFSIDGTLNMKNEHTTKTYTFRNNKIRQRDMLTLAIGHSPADGKKHYVSRYTDIYADKIA